MAGKASAILRASTGEDDQSISFSVDPEMYTKLAITKPRRGEEHSTYDTEKMYTYQLDRDIKKMVSKRGSYAQREKKFMDIRMIDSEYAAFADTKPFGTDGNFVELQKKTIPISWTATCQPYGEIAHKRYLEYLANLPKGPTEDEIKDKQQRAMDQELWTKVITGRTEPTKKELAAAAREARREELRAQGLTDEEQDETPVLSLAEERQMHINHHAFEKLRCLPTRREYQSSMSKWHRGIYYPYKHEKGFPVVNGHFRDTLIGNSLHEGADMNKQYAAVVLKKCKLNESAYTAYLGRTNYTKAKDYLDARKDKLERKAIREEKAKAQAEKSRRRVGLQGMTISNDLWQARLLHAKDELAFTAHIEKADGHVIHEHKTHGLQPKVKKAADSDSSESDDHPDADDPDGDEQVVTNAQIHEEDYNKKRRQWLKPLFKGRSASVLPEGGEVEGQAGEGVITPMIRALSESAVARGFHHIHRSLRHLHGYLYDGAVFKSSTQLRKDHTMKQLQTLLDDICVDTFVDDVLELSKTELTTEEYVEEMLVKRRFFNFKITELVKAAKTSEEAVKSLHMIKRRLELFEEANHQRLTKQLQAEHEIDLMKEVLLEQEAQAMTWEDTRLERIQSWLIRKLARKPAKKAIEGKKLAQFLPPVEAEGYETVVKSIFAERILERQKEDKQKSRVAKLAGLEYSNDLSKKTADDLVIAAECGDYKTILDLLDKRDTLEFDEIEPRIPVDSVNTDGITATFATLFMIMNKEILDTEVDFDDLTMTTMQRLFRKLVGKKKKANEPRVDLVLQILLYYGGSLSYFKQTTKDALSMLHYATISGSVEMLEWLLQKGLSVNQLTKQMHRTPLMLAVERNHMDIVMVLLRHGAISGIHNVDKDGNNVLHFAARSASPVLVKILLLCGAKTSLRNHLKQLPAEKARAFNRFDVSALMATYKSPVKDELSRIQFLYDTELSAFDTRALRFEAEQAEDDAEDLFEGTVVPRLTLDTSIKETNLAMLANQKRSQSYRMNKMWQATVQESVKMTTSLPSTPGSLGRRQSHMKLLAPSSDSNSSRKTIVSAEKVLADRKLKHRVLHKSFIQHNTLNAKSVGGIGV